MKNIFLIFFSLMIFCSIAKPVYVNNHEQPLPRIAIAGIAIESSTFSPARTDEAAFHAQYGEEVHRDAGFIEDEHDESVHEPAVGRGADHGSRLRKGARRRTGQCRRSRGRRA